MERGKINLNLEGSFIKFGWLDQKLYWNEHKSYFLKVLKIVKLNECMVARYNNFFASVIKNDN